MKKIFCLITYTVLFFSLTTSAQAAPEPYSLGHNFGGQSSNPSSQQTVTMNYGCDSDDPCPEEAYPYEIIVIHCTGDNPYTLEEGDCSDENNLATQTGDIWVGINSQGVGSRFWSYTATTTGCYQVDFRRNHDLSGNPPYSGIFCYAPTVSYVRIGGRVINSSGTGISGVNISVYDNNLVQTKTGPNPLSLTTNINGDFWVDSFVRVNDDYAVYPPSTAPSGYINPPNPSAWNTQNAGGTQDCGPACSFTYTPLSTTISAAATTGGTSITKTSVWPQLTLIINTNDTSASRVMACRVGTYDCNGDDGDDGWDPITSGLSPSFGQGNRSYTWTPPTAYEAGTYYFAVYPTGTPKLGNRSNAVSFNAPTVVVPTVTTNAATSLALTSATFNGNVISNGGATLTDRGFYYTTATTAPGSNGTGTKISAGETSTGTYSKNQGSLTSSTQYWVQAYATNSQGTGYGSWQTFDTQTPAPVLPLVTTDAATSIEQSTATLNSSINPKGSLTTGWFIYSRNDPGGISSTSCQNNLNADSAKTTTTTSTVGSDNISHPKIQAISSLLAGTTYYFCAIADNDAGTTYGSIRSLLTKPDVSLSLSSTSMVSSKSVASGNSVTLYWTVTGTATSCTATDDWTGSKTSTGGNESMTLSNTGTTTITKTFGIYCSNATGASPTRRVTVSVAPAGTTPGPTISGTPSCVSGGSYNATLTWTGAGYNTGSCGTGFWVDIDNDNNWGNGYYHACISDPTRSTVAPSGFGAFNGATGTLALQPGVTYYARTYNGTQSAVTPFGPIAACPPTVDLTVDGQLAGKNGSIAVASGTSHNLNWTTTNNPTTCTASGGWTGPQATNASNGPTSTGNLTSSTTYSILCSNGEGSDTDSVTVNVTGAPTITLNPPTGSPAASCATPYVDLAWTSSGLGANPTYDIYRNGAVILTGTTATSYRNNTGLTAGTPYSYQIRSGATPSNILSATPAACSGTPPSSTGPWIQTVGGDVHSNTYINTPGGP